MTERRDAQRRTHGAADARLYYFNKNTCHLHVFRGVQQSRALRHEASCSTEAILAPEKVAPPRGAGTRSTRRLEFASSDCLRVARPSRGARCRAAPARLARARAHCPAHCRAHPPHTRRTPGRAPREDPQTKRDEAKVVNRLSLVVRITPNVIVTLMGAAHRAGSQSAMRVRPGSAEHPSQLLRAAHGLPIRSV